MGLSCVQGGRRGGAFNFVHVSGSCSSLDTALNSSRSGLTWVSWQSVQFCSTVSQKLPKEAHVALQRDGIWYIYFHFIFGSPTLDMQGGA